MKRLRRDAVAIVGLVVVVVSALVAIFAPALAPGDPIKNSLLDRLTPPMWLDGGSAKHPLGTDTLGRDVASRLLYGARVSLIVGFAAVVISGLVGVALGLLSGFYRGWLDDLLMRLGDVQLAFPVLVLAVAVLAVLGANLLNLIIVLAVTSWITYARIVRGETLSLREREFVDAARSLGARSSWVLVRELLPNLAAPILVYATLLIPTNILFEAALSFLGVGIRPPTATWGGMLADAVKFYTQPHFMLWPGLAIFVTVLAFNLFGDGLRDALDPRGR